MKRWFMIFILVVSGFFFSGCNPLFKKAKSGLQVQITDKVAASVYLDGNFVEKTPFISKELSPGEHTLKIQPDDPTLIPYEIKVSLKPGLLTVVTWKLAERPEYSGGVMYEMEPINSKNKSEISFITIPDGAIITVAGKEKTFSPVIIPNVDPGHVEFEVSLPSYGIQKHTINTLPGYRMLVTVKLAKENPDSMNSDTAESGSNNETGSNNDLGSLESSTTPTSNSAQLASPAPKVSAVNAVATPVLATTSANIRLGATDQKVQIKSTNFFVNGKEVLRVRDLPGSNGKELGFAEVGSLYPYLGNTQYNWFNIQFNGQSGWVSGQYAQLVQ